MIAWINDLNDSVLADYDTRLSGGFEEPFYRAPHGGGSAEIQFTQDHERSALHELAHWCVAGEQRRRRDDYGYWYQPDGRNNAEQRLFFRVEVKPQAIEKHFCHALDIPFDVSVDNLGNTDINGVCDFRKAVDAQYRAYADSGLPVRAAAMYRFFTTLRKQPVNHLAQSRKGAK
jgi:elongation factor P hydroxylase